MVEYSFPHILAATYSLADHDGYFMPHIASRGEVLDSFVHIAHADYRRAIQTAASVLAVFPVAGWVEMFAGTHRRRVGRKHPYSDFLARLSLLFRPFHRVSDLLHFFGWQVVGRNVATFSPLPFVNFFAHVVAFCGSRRLGSIWDHPRLVRLLTNIVQLSVLQHASNLSYPTSNATFIMSQFSPRESQFYPPTTLYSYPFAAQFRLLSYHYPTQKNPVAGILERSFSHRPSTGPLIMPLHRIPR